MVSLEELLGQSWLERKPDFFAFKIADRGELVENFVRGFELGIFESKVGIHNERMPQTNLMVSMGQVVASGKA